MRAGSGNVARAGTGAGATDPSEVLQMIDYATRDRVIFIRNMSRRMDWDEGVYLYRDYQQHLDRIDLPQRRQTMIPYTGKQKLGDR